VISAEPFQVVDSGIAGGNVPTTFVVAQKWIDQLGGTP
jgi:hypothetical protein